MLFETDESVEPVAYVVTVEADRVMVVISERYTRIKRIAWTAEKKVSTGSASSSEPPAMVISRDLTNERAYLVDDSSEEDRGRRKMDDRDRLKSENQELKI